jgi:hypothetical protein
LGPNSWTFLCYYLTNHPPESHQQSLAQLFARSYELAPQKEAGEPEEASDKPSATIQRLWLQLLNDGVLRKERLL